MDDENDSSDVSMSSARSTSLSPPRRQYCNGKFAKQDHEDSILHILQRLGSKSFAVLRKMTKQPELADIEWEVDKLLDIVIDDGEWYLLKWKDWPASFASWERAKNYKLDSVLVAEYKAQIAANVNPAADFMSTSDSDVVEEGLAITGANITAAVKKRAITIEELSEVARSLAKHVSWPVFLRVIQRLDREMTLNIFKKDEAIFRKDLYLQHLYIPCGLSEVASNFPRGMIARKRLEWKLSQLENVRVQIINDEDDEPIPQLPPGFEYIVSNRYTAPDISPDILESLVGCNCRSCVPGTRKCCSQQAGVSFAYRDDVQNTLLDSQRSQAIYECTSRCKCSPETCSNRVLQKGLTCPMQLFKTKGRGWGLKALKPIKRGEFVIEYIGEVITSAQADEREGNQYLFDLDFNPEGDGMYTIDAMTYGNLSRFINSRCGDANLSSLAVYVDCQHPDLPRIGFFAKRDIEPLEELTFDYMMQGGSAGFESCLCGSSQCRGTINIQNPGVELNPSPVVTEDAIVVPRAKKTARSRRRGGNKKSQHPASAQNEPEADDVDVAVEGGEEAPQYPMMDMSDFSSPTYSHNHGRRSHVEFNNSDVGGDDVVILNNVEPKKNVSVIDLVDTPSSNCGKNFVADDYSEEEDEEDWHHAHSEPANQVAHDVISLDSPSPPKSNGSSSPPMLEAQSPTHSLLSENNHINGNDSDAFNGEDRVNHIDLSRTKNIDISSADCESICSGEKEDHNVMIPMDIPTSPVTISGEQTLAH